ncbi:hypothetical protein BGZ98_005124 [Dissophora globulifera]|nr:hypothetical protein BGZ98_005124 [Dissophora globulifera]
MSLFESAVAPPNTNCVSSRFYQSESFFLATRGPKNYSYVTKIETTQFLVGGPPTAVKEPDYTTDLSLLAFCVVSSDLECDDQGGHYCINENEPYRIRASNYYNITKGYLRVVNPFIDFVATYQEASLFSLSKVGTGPRIHIAHWHQTGPRNVFTNKGTGVPLALESPAGAGGANQDFEIVEIP